MQPHTVAVVCSTANIPAPECCSGVRESQAGSVNSQDSWGQRTGSGHLWLGHVWERVKSLIYAKNSQSSIHRRSLCPKAATKAIKRVDRLVKVWWKSLKREVGKLCAAISMSNGDQVAKRVTDRSSPAHFKLDKFNHQPRCQIRTANFALPNLEVTILQFQPIELTNQSHHFTALGSPALQGLQVTAYNWLWALCLQYSARTFLWWTNAKNWKWLLSYLGTICSQF